MLMAAQPRNRIKELLTIKGWSIYEFAERAKIAYPQLYRLVKAEQIPPGTNLSTVKKIARALEVSIEDLETKEVSGITCPYCKSTNTTGGKGWWECLDCGKEFPGP